MLLLVIHLRSKILQRAKLRDGEANNICLIKVLISWYFHSETITIVRELPMVTGDSSTTSLPKYCGNTNELLCE